ncbi:unnamed protein product [Effrenium voratum]|uniref:Uncharacterized protein n=1 Tax=Effrenium voratum TaxID=2562239 RepID=A0AA36N0F6_9DINO|nr:unnamed protein product [Effrenium voratum]CAJ1437969.1 unnamed protein product [Effrenium voratum]
MWRLACALLILGARALDAGASRLHQFQANALRQRLQQLDPEQQQDLAMVVPYIQKGDKAAFKKGLSVMVQHGGNDRIKRCLQGLAEVGFDALEIQRWLQQDGAPVPKPKTEHGEAERQPVPPREAAAKRMPAPSVGAMAGLAAEQQLAAGKEQQKTEVQGKTTHAATAKSALRKELARRLAKGVEALKRVEAVEKNEAGVRQSLAAEQDRVGHLEQALHKEEEERAEVSKENSQLKQELQHEEELNKQAFARLDALEKARNETGMDRVAVLEDQNVKFRAALAGAARRLINLEADVTSQRQLSSMPEGPKIVRHEKA